MELEGSDEETSLLLGGGNNNTITPDLTNTLGAGPNVTKTQAVNQTVIDIKGTAPSTNENAPPLAQTPPTGFWPRRDELHSPQQPKTLKQEFALVNFDLNNVKLEEVSL